MHGLRALRASVVNLLRVLRLGKLSFESVLFSLQVEKTRAALALVDA
jgi:hypothetical protein